MNKRLSGKKRDEVIACMPGSRCDEMYGQRSQGGRDSGVEEENEDSGHLDVRDAKKTLSESMAPRCV